MNTVNPYRAGYPTRRTRSKKRPLKTMQFSPEKSVIVISPDASPKGTTPVNRRSLKRTHSGNSVRPAKKSKSDASLKADVRTHDLPRLFTPNIKLDQNKLTSILRSIDQPLTCSVLDTTCPAEVVDRLEPGEELSDALISMSMSLCKARDIQQGNHDKNLYWSPLRFYSQICKQKSLVRGVKISLENTDRIFQPVNVTLFTDEGETETAPHWMLLIANLKSSQIVYMDTLSQDYSTHAEHFRTWLANNTTGYKGIERFRIIKKDLPTQHASSNDCGVGLLWAINKLSIQHNPRLT